MVCRCNEKISCTNFYSHIGSKHEESTNKCMHFMKEAGGFLVGHLLSEDDHPHCAPPYWNIMKETFYSGIAEL